MAPSKIDSWRLAWRAIMAYCVFDAARSLWRMWHPAPTDYEVISLLARHPVFVSIWAILPDVTIFAIMWVIFYSVGRLIRWNALRSLNAKKWGRESDP